MTGGPRWLARIGLAIVDPRQALAVASDRRHAGRSGSDLILMIFVLLAATQLRGLVSAVWFFEESAGLAGRTLIAVLTRSLVVDLAFLVLGALLVWLLAGRHRNLGRAFDLLNIDPVLPGGKDSQCGAVPAPRALSSRHP